MKIIDRKFNIVAVNPCKPNITYDEYSGIFFPAKDRAVIPMLNAYKNICIDLGSNPEHIESIELLINRVVEYQVNYCKVPDTETDCEIDRCIGGIGVDTGD